MHAPTYLISDMAERKMAHIQPTKTVKYLKIYLIKLTESTERNPIKTHDPGFRPYFRIKRLNTVNMPLFYLKLTYTFTTRLQQFQVRSQWVLWILTKYLSSAFGRTDAWKHTRIFKAKPRWSSKELRRGREVTHKHETHHRITTVTKGGRERIERKESLSRDGESRGREWVRED